MEQIKVAMICHLSTQELRDKLELDNRRLYAFARKLLRMPHKQTKYSDYAPWNANLIEQLEVRDDIELHVISAHDGLKKIQTSFKLRNTSYTFIKCDYTTLFRRLIPSVELWKKLNVMTPLVHRKVREINPDIVIMVGAEMAYVSSTILGLEKKYPICVLTQTIYNNPDRSKYSKIDKKNAAVELEIFQRIRHIGVFSDMHENLLKQLTKSKIDIFRYNFPVAKLPVVSYSGTKQFDFVNFAMNISLQKGFHDSIKALAIVKDKYPDVKLNLVGQVIGERKKELEEMIEELGLKENISFTPSFEKQVDVFEHIQKARFAVLPCKLDNISGTMIQAMNYHLPIVVYKTPGTPSLNVHEQCALIASHSDVEDLARKMIALLDDENLGKEMIQNSVKYMDRYYNESRSNLDNLVGNMKRIIKEEHRYAN